MTATEASSCLDVSSDTGWMPMTLPDGEPAAGPWRSVPIRELVDVLVDAAGNPDGRPRIVAVDGRGASGKSTIADRIIGEVPSSVVVHTDDVAWHHSFFDWAGLLAGGVLEPVRRGAEVSYRPPAWVARDRGGAIEVPAGLDLVVVEGVGAGRHELTHLLDAVLWVQSDFTEARRRGIARDVAAGENGGSVGEATEFWGEWMSEEIPFLVEQRPWERACFVVAGTPTQRVGAGHVLIADPPLPAG